MNLFIRQGRTPLLAAVAVVAAVFASGASAQTAQKDTAYVPFIVNVDATVKAAATDGSAPVQISVMAGVEAFMRIPVAKGIGVTYFGAQRQANAPSIVSSRNGKVTLNLPAQSYKSAEVALYTVNGKRIFRNRVSASNAVNNISRPNLATGAYLLSVKGAGGEAAVTTRLTHNGGGLDISVAFGGENRARAKGLAKQAAAGDWNITVSSEGYVDKVYTLNPKAGVNAAQNITLYAVSSITYEVVVLSEGTGATPKGSYGAGTPVAINAGTADGKTFKVWKTADDGVDFADSTNPTTTFIMPAKAVTVMGIFEQTGVEAAKYAVTVTSPGTGASGTGSYAPGTVVNIMAGTPPTGQRFKEWTTNNSDLSFNNPNDANTKFTMPAANVTVTAVFESEAEPAKTYKLTVTSAGSGKSGDGTYRADTTININAGTAPSGKKFKEWTTTPANSGTFGDKTKSATTFKMPANAVTVTANFEDIKYTVTLSNAGTGPEGGGEYAKDMTVNIAIGTPPEGKMFKNWTTTSAGVTFTDANSPATTFKMPGNDVTLSVVFVDIVRHSVTVEGYNAIGGGDYVEGATVSIQTALPPTNVFVKWTSANSGVEFNDAYSFKTSFKMPASDVTVSANFASDRFTDARNSKMYFTVALGGKVWMRANLNYDTADGTGSWCYGNSPDSCTKYGRLYNWGTAMAGNASSDKTPSEVRGVCPSGWHLPSRGEWGDLAKAAGGTGEYGTGGNTAGEALKANTGWYEDGNGTSSSTEFYALPGGRFYDNFLDVGKQAGWWTATENDGSRAYDRMMTYSGKNVTESSSTKSIGFSVRCVKD